MNISTTEIDHDVIDNNTRYCLQIPHYNLYTCYHIITFVTKRNTRILVYVFYKKVF